MPIQIDEKLFAHIQNDAFLAGSDGLEGNHFVNTIGYLNKYLESLPPGGLPQDVKKMQAACNQLVIIEERMHQAITKTQTTALSQQIVSDIATLEEGDYLLMPGGWLKHAIIYQFSKDENGDLLFSINNSGAGLQFHEKKSDTDKELYNPVLTYKIPKESLQDKDKTKDLAAIVQALIEAQSRTLHKQGKQNEKFLYQEVFPQLVHVDGEIDFSNEQRADHWYTAGQASGTCAQRSLHQMLKSRFDSLDSYRKFIYGFKKQALDDYIDKLRSEDRLKDPKYQSQINKGIRHALRLLLLDSSQPPNEPLFSKEQIEKDKAQLTGYLSEMGQNILSTPNPNNTENLLSLEPLSPQYGFATGGVARVNEAELSEFKTETILPALKQNSDKLTFDEMDELINQCETLKGAANHHQVIELIEKYLAALPLPEQNIADALLPYYSEIDSEEKAHLFYKKINQIQTLYFSSCDTLLSDKITTPAMVLSSLSIFSVVGHINSQFSLNQPAPYHEIIESSIYSLSRQSRDTVYLSQSHPDLDKRLNHIKGLYKRVTFKLLNGFEQNYYQYYQAFINQYPDLKQKLEKFYVDKGYGASGSKEHQAYKEKGVTSLYCFFNYRQALIDHVFEDGSTFKDNTDFEALSKQLIIQEEMEKAYSYSNKRLRGDSRQETATFKLQHPRNQIKTDSYLINNHSNFKISAPLYAAKYKSNDDDINAVLKQDDNTSDKKGSSKTQLKPANPSDKIDSNQRIIQKSDLAERQLSHLRQDPHCQLTLTLDHFSEKMYQLKSNDIQTYIEANIFQPGLLIKQLEGNNAEQFLEQFDTFVEDGLKYFKKNGGLSEPSLFFLKLKSKLNQYALHLDPDKYQPRWQAFNHELTTQITLSKDSSIQHVLHRSRFQSLMAQSAHRSLESAEFNLALQSYFMCQSTANHQEVRDIDSTFSFSKDRHLFKKILTKNLENIDKNTLLKIVAFTAPTFKASEKYDLSQLKYPILEITSPNGELLYTLNIEQGLIYKDAMAFSALPVSIVTHPMFKQLGLSENACTLVSKDGRAFEINQPPQSVRFIQNGDDYHVQKKFTDLSGENTWYQLKAQSSAKFTQENLPLNDIMVPKISEILKEKDHYFWRHQDKDEMLITNALQQKEYTAVLNSHWDWTFSKVNGLGDLCAQNSALHKKFSAIEDKKFIHVFEKNSTHTIHLARYNLSFKVAEKSSAPSFSWQGSDYSLDNDQVNLGEGVSALSLSNDHDNICIILIQPYINTGRRQQSSEYYRLKQDVSGQVANKIIENAIGKETPQLLQHSNTQNSFIFKIDAKGHPIPQTSQEALYLCYLYLGSNQTDKAWQMLALCDTSLGGLSGSYEELNYISWMFNSLPYVLDPKNEVKAEISNPDVTACKLKTLSLLTRYYQRGSKFKLPSINQFPESHNDIYQNKLIENVMGFESSLNSTLHDTYSQHLKITRDELSTFQLDDSEKKSLLNYYHDALPEPQNGGPKAIGALGAEWVSLQFHELKKEKHLLQAKSSPSPYEIKRIKEIDDFIRHHNGVAKKSSKLAVVTIDTSIKAGTQLNQDILTHDMQKKVGKKEFLTDLSQQPNGEEDAIHALKPDISDEDFLHHFTAYLNIALDEDNTHQQRLKRYCKNTLIAARHTSLEMQSSNVPLLCNVLLRVIESKQPLPQGIFARLWGNKPINILINYAQTLEAPNIEVKQLVDTTTDILLSSEKVVESLPENRVKKKVTLTMTDRQQVDNVSLFDANNKTSLLDNMAWWQQEEACYDKGPQDTLENQANEALPLETNEFYAGKAKFEALKNLQNKAEQLFTPPAIASLTAHIKKELIDKTAEKESLEQALIELANQGPDDPIKNQKWQLEIAAGKREKFDINRIMRLYFQNDLDNYALKTGLSQQDILKLHGLIALYIKQSLAHQQLERIDNQIKNIDSASDEEKTQAKVKLGQALFANNQVDIIDEPELSVFQYFQDILMRPSQTEAINRLLAQSSSANFSETIEQIIMGGGKSKVISPALAYKKANGTNLVIIEVPASLLETNYGDLKSTSKKFFNQDVELFNFNRDWGCSSKELEQMHQRLTDVIVNKKYLVTTGDALQSVELKYLELLSAPPETDLMSEEEAEEAIKEWTAQVSGADKLVNLFRQRGDLIIDEVHKGLILKNKLNYTLGESGRLNKFTLKQTLALYKFFNNVNFSTDEGRQVNLMDAVRDNTLLNTEQTLEIAFSACIKELVEKEDSPLFSFCKSLTKKDKSKLIAYLSDEATALPTFISTASRDDKNKLALYKEQLSHLLPYTVKRNHKENYGPSHSKTHSPEVCSLAIPYIASDTPNERSRFGNPLETLNFSIQSLLIEGVSLELIHAYIKFLQTEARQEITLNPGISTNSNIYSLQFKSIIGDNSAELLDIDLDDETQLAKIHQEIAHNPSLIFDVLEKQSLQNIRTDPEILHSDAYNHVDLVRSCQGITGTPWNHSTFHQRLNFDKNISQGTDGLVYQSLAAKNPNINGFEFKNTKTAIQNLFDKYDSNSPMRAFIDISATFKGIPNREIANELADYFKNNPDKFSQPKKIKHILFFNENNEITALPLHDYPKGEPIVIGSSDINAINQRLGSTPEERFSLYDQAHTVGTDLKQMNTAKAIVMIDQRTSLSSFFQGVMRLRGFIEGNQSLDIVVPPSMADLSLDELCQAMHENELAQLKNDNYHATQLKLNNIVRSQVVKQILAIDGEGAARQKQKLFTQFKEIFIEVKDDNLFEMYGGLTKRKSTKELLELQKKSLLDKYKILSSSIEAQEANRSLELMKNEMTLIIDSACKEGVCHETQVISSSALAEEVEVQNEVQVEVEEEVEKEQEFFDATLKESDYIPWHRKRFPLSKTINLSVNAKTITQICQSASDTVPTFSKNIKATVNFYQSYENQTKYVGMYLKPVHALLFMQKEDGLECYMLSGQECEELSSNPDYLKEHNAWLSTTNHHILEGSPITGFQDNPDYQTIIEQVRFFNGEFSSLLKNDTALNWLSEDSNQKMQFFSEHLYNNHQTLTGEVAQLKQRLLNNTKMYKFILANPLLESQAPEYWQAKFEGITEEQVEELEQMLKTTKDIHSAWPEKIDWGKASNLSPAVIGYIKKYEMQLEACMDMVNLWHGAQPADENPARIRALFKYAELKGLNAEEYILKIQQAEGAVEEDFTLDLIIDMLTTEQLSYPAKLLQLIALKEPLDERYFEIALKDAGKNPLLYRNLLMNKSVANNEERLERLAGTATETHIILMHAKSSYLSNKQVSILLSNARANPFFDSTFQTLIQNESIDINEVAKLLSNSTADLFSAEESLLLLNQITDIDVFLDIVDKTENIKENLSQITERLLYLLEPGINTPINRDVLKKITGHFVDEQEQLVVIAQKRSHSHFKRKIVLKMSCQMKDPIQIRDFLMDNLGADGEDEIAPEILHETERDSLDETDTESVSDDGTTNTLAEYKSIVKALKSHAIITDVTLANTKLPVKQQLKELSAITLLERAKATGKVLPTSLLFRIAENAQSTETLASLIDTTPAPIDSEVLSKILNNQSISKDLLDTICQNTQLSYENIEDIIGTLKYFKAINEGALSKLVSNSNFSEEFVFDILFYTEEAFIIDAILQKESLQHSVFFMLTSEFIQSLSNKPNKNRSLLNEEQLLTLVSHSDFLPEPDKVNKISNVETFSKSKVYNLILQHEKLNKKILLKLISKTTEFDLLLKIIASNKFSDDAEIINAINEVIDQIQMPENIYLSEGEFNWFINHRRPEGLIKIIRNEADCSTENITAIIESETMPGSSFNEALVTAILNRSELSDTQFIALISHNKFPIDSQKINNLIISKVAQTHSLELILSIARSRLGNKDKSVIAAINKELDLKDIKRASSFTKEDFNWWIKNREPIHLQRVILDPNFCPIEVLDAIFESDKIEDLDLQETILERKDLNNTQLLTLVSNKQFKNHSSETNELILAHPKLTADILCKVIAKTESLSLLMDIAKSQLGNSDKTVIEAINNRMYNMDMSNVDVLTEDDFDWFLKNRHASGLATLVSNQKLCPSANLASLINSRLIPENQFNEALISAILNRSDLSDTQLIALISHRQFSINSLNIKQLIINKIEKTNSFQLILDIAKSPLGNQDGGVINLMLNKAMDEVSIPKNLTLSETDFNWILNNRSNNGMKALISNTTHCSPQHLSSLIKSDRILELGIIKTILQRADLSSSQLLFLVSNKALTTISPENCEKILKHPKAETSIVLELINKTKTFKSLMTIAKSQLGNSDKTVIEAINNRLGSIDMSSFNVLTADDFDWFLKNRYASGLATLVSNASLCSLDILNPIFKSDRIDDPYIKEAILQRSDLIDEHKLILSPRHDIDAQEIISPEAVIQNPSPTVIIEEELPSVKPGPNQEVNVKSPEQNITSPRVLPQQEKKPAPLSPAQLQARREKEFKDLLAEVSQLGSASDNDTQVAEYESKIWKEFNDCKTEEDIKTLLTQVTATRDSLKNSDQLNQVKQVIINLQPKLLSFWPLVYFAKSYLDKISRIYTALENVPLEKRANFFAENEETKQVRKAIASHRYTFFKSETPDTENKAQGFVYLNTDKDVDEDKAARSFTTFKENINKQLKAEKEPQEINKPK